LGRLRVAIRTVGCRANQADSAALLRGLDPEVVELVEELADADVTVVNTCCVTAQAERDCRKAARRALRESPGSRVILVGCAVSGVPGFGSDLGEGIETGPGGGAGGSAALCEALNLLAGSASASTPGGIAPSASRSRPLLKVQNGCEHRCAYCVVPLARGPERSTPIAPILDEVDRIAAGGFRELVLTGVQIGAWGNDLPGRPRLPQLLERVADRFSPGRVRLSSIEPWSVDEALVDVVANHGRVCPHLHVPMQSGNDRILGAMGRGHGAAEFCARIETARRRIDDLAFGTDVICGFPGEDEAAFRSTLAILERLAPSNVHAFSYSPRPGTRASGWAAPGRAAAKDRANRVIALAGPLRERFAASQTGKVREVLVEEAGEVARGLTDNFLPVRLDRAGASRGGLVMARLGAGDDAGEIAATVPPEPRPRS